MLIETAMLGPLDVRPETRPDLKRGVRDVEPDVLLTKVRALLSRPGPRAVKASDGREHLWPLEQTPPLLIVVPGALTIAGAGEVRRDRARATLYMVSREAYHLYTAERLRARPGAIVAAVCELEDLRTWGWCAPIWYLVRVPTGPFADGYAEQVDFIDYGMGISLVDSDIEKRSLLTVRGHIDGAFRAVPHDLSGLGLPWRRRLEEGQEIAYRSGRPRRI